MIQKICCPGQQTTTPKVISNRVLISTGKDGITPHINPVTGNWMIGDYDTGYKAGYKDGELAPMMVFEDKALFPASGVDGVIYVSERESNIYRWDAKRTMYVSLTPPQANVIYCGDSEV